MKGQRNTPEYWTSLVEQHFYLGNEFALIPITSFPERTAIGLADRLDVRLERWGDDYLFQQKTSGTFNGVAAQTSGQPSASFRSIAALNRFPHEDSAND